MMAINTIRATIFHANSGYPRLKPREGQEGWEAKSTHQRRGRAPAILPYSIGNDPE